mgnify:CR=1 FL=1
MFVPLARILKKTIHARGVGERIAFLEKKERVERIVEKVIGKKVPLVKIQHHTVFLRPGSPHTTGEIRLKEKEIVKKLITEGVPVQSIKYVI